MPNDLDVMLFEQINSEAERGFALGDVLDMKANVWLVVITFLATETAYFLSRGLSTYVRYGQIISVAALVVAGAITLICLLPREYMLFCPSNGVIERRLEKLREEHKDKENAESLIQARILKEQINWSKEAIKKNRNINKLKSNMVSWAFYFTVISATINLVTLVSFIKRPF